MPPSSASDSVSYQPRAASGCPSGPRIGAISASAMPTGRVALVDDASAQPAALVGHRDEARAVGCDADRRDAAELLVRTRSVRGRREIRARRSGGAPDRAARTPRSAAALDLDLDRRLAARAACGCAEAESEQTAAAARRRQAPRVARRKAHAMQPAARRARARLGGSVPLSNSSASFSVIAPPSSSASTMVTARR